MLLNSLVSSLLGLPKPAEPAPSTPPQDSQSGQSAATSAQANSPQDAETTTSVTPPAVSPPSRPTSESIVVALSENVSPANANGVTDSSSDSGPSRTAVEAYAANDAGGAASASVLAAGQSSQSSTWIMPEVALDENAARAAAEAYRAEARQTSILEGLAATPDVVDLGQQESNPTNATAAANPYGQMAVAESGSSNAFVSATPLNKVA